MKNGKLEPENGKLEPGSWNLELGSWKLEPGSWKLVSQDPVSGDAGARAPEEPGGARAQYMYRLAWTCQLN